MISTLRIERTLINKADERPPVYKVRLITNAGDVLTPTKEQETAALMLMALFDLPAKDEEKPGAPDR